jgi:hypothetical protein
MNILHRYVSACACRIVVWTARHALTAPEFVRDLARDGMVHVHGPMILDPEVEISPALAFDLLRTTAKALPHRPEPYRAPWVVPR